MMRNPVSTESIRERVRAIFQSHGVAPQAEIHETILIRSGCYCGRRFACDGLEAVWFVEEDQLKVFARSGVLCDVRSASLAPAAHAARAA